MKRFVCIAFLNYVLGYLDLAVYSTHLIKYCNYNIFVINFRANAMTIYNAYYGLWLVYRRPPTTNRHISTPNLYLDKDVSLYLSLDYYFKCSYVTKLRSFL